MNAKYKVLIVDDHVAVIEGIKSLLRDREDVEVIGEALNGQDAMAKVFELKPDIVIMDLFMPAMNGRETTMMIKNKFPMTRVVIYTMYSDPSTILELFKLGISAYVLKDGPFSDLVIALEAVKRDGTFFRTAALQSVADHLQQQGRFEQDMDRLSKREKEVFELLVQGKTSKAVGEQLHLSRKTVETHKFHVMQKLGIHGIVDLIHYSINVSGRKK
jgi:two-component system, NarL family, response regulator NreC